MQTAVTEDVDVVYTWVDGSDPAFQAALRRHLSAAAMADDPAVAGCGRYRDNGELRYSLRLLLRFAPWVRRVYIVTNGQVPPWLDLTHPKIRLVTHAEIFPDPADLPTFNSNAITLHLHRIPGLSRRFLYFNDDVFLGRPVRKSDFFLAGGGQQVFLQQTHVPDDETRGSARDRACAHTQTVLTRLWGRPPAARLLLAHTPHPYDREALARLAALLPEEFRRTSSHRFRSADDLVLDVLYSCSLFESPEERGRHRIQTLSYSGPRYCFLMLENRPLWAMRAYASMLRRRQTFFCINDDMGNAPAHHPLLLSIRAFLSVYLATARCWIYRSDSRDADS